MVNETERLSMRLEVCLNELLILPYDSRRNVELSQSLIIRGAVSGFSVAHLANVQIDPFGLHPATPFLILTIGCRPVC